MIRLELDRRKRNKNKKRSRMGLEKEEEQEGGMENGDGGKSMRMVDGEKSERGGCRRIVDRKSAANHLDENVLR